MDAIIDAVAATLRELGQSLVLPYWRALAPDQIEEKAPGDLVTIADRAVEEALARALTALLPNARFIGEERCARDPGLLSALDDESVWVVDPIDGTGNFAAGTTPFALMVALLQRGEIVAAWIHDPVQDSMAVAERSSGAWLDGLRLTTGQAALPLDRLRGIVSGFQMPDAWSSPVASLKTAVGKALPTRRCAGAEYPLVATGEMDFALYWRSLVWDHAAGALLLTESGGEVLRLDGSRYRPGSTGTGLLLAGNGAIADAVLRQLRSDRSPP